MYFNMSGKDLPLISLIIPMHNTEEFVAECLDSVARQTYKNLEIIVVDDDSTDSSAKIVNSYADRLPNVIYIKTKNGNAARTRRDGLAKATADLVCFVDADDIIEEGYIERLYETMITTKTSISACNMETFSGIYKKKVKTSNPTTPYTIDSNAGAFADHYHITTTNKLTLQTVPCKLFKKELFNDIDYTVLVTNIFEDNFILAQIMSKVEKIGVINETLYWYRQVPGTTSDGTVKTMVDYNGKKFNSVEFFRDVVMAYCRQTLRGPNVDAAIERICAAEFFNYARMVPDLIVRKEYLEQRNTLDKEIIESKEAKINSILDSDAYRLGDALIKKISKITAIFKKRGR